MVQFLKGSMDSDNMEVLKRLEPEFKLFRFEKSPVVFDQLSEEEKEEARINIRNGLNFSKKETDSEMLPRLPRNASIFLQ